ncbi:MAG: hypothetical protein KDA54_21785 [Phycisphaerales bacterium]|nr:hypothetical protein [Phycisphaerales bacterium]
MIISTVIAIWLTVSIKCGCVYFAACIASATMWRDRPAFRAWLWPMVILSFAVLTVFEFVAGDHDMVADWVRSWPNELLSCLFFAQVVISASLLGMLSTSIVRCMLLRRHRRWVNPRAYLSTFADGPLAPAFALWSRVHVRQGENGSVPTSFGVFWPTVVLPLSMTGIVHSRFAPAALIHEFVAVLRFDALWSLVGRFVQCVYWENPFVWLAWQSYRQASQEVRDEWSAFALGDRDLYARNIRDAGNVARTAPMMSVDTPMVTPNRSELRRRVAKIERKPLRQPNVLSQGAQTTLLVVCLLMLAIIGSVNASNANHGGHELGLNSRALLLCTGLILVGIILWLGVDLGMPFERQRKHVWEVEIPGAFRQTVAETVDWGERQWKDLWPMRRVANQLLTTGLTISLFVLVLYFALSELQEDSPPGLIEIKTTSPGRVP